MEQDTNKAGYVEGRWSGFDSKRKPHLERCRDCSELTIPNLLPRDGVTENDQQPTPYQALGARAVNNLSAKLLLALFPPNTPFFQLNADEQTTEELKEQMGDKEFKTKIEKQLRKYERIVVKDFEALAQRTKMFKVIRLLVVTGNALLEQLNTGKIKVYRLDKYVVRRSPNGDLKEIIIRELVTLDDIPSSIKNHPEAHQQPTVKADSQARNDIPLFTHIIWNDRVFEVHQEVLGLRIPGTEATYPKDKLPFLPLSWALNDGENYGRGHVEEHLGDFVAYDGLCQSLLEGAAAAALLIFLKKPNATTNLLDLKKARNGQFIEGNEDDIGCLKVDKQADFQFAYNTSKEIEGRLSRAFLLQEAIQRDAERVTAEEIRYMAQQLEDTLGGVYSVLGVELQGPLASLLMANMRKRGKLPALPKEVDITITTGFEALGRGHDLQKLREFRDEVVAMGQASQSPDIVTLYIGMSNYFMRVATAIGLDTDGLVPTSEEIDMIKKQQQQIQQLMEMMKTGAATQVAKGAMDQFVEGKTELQPIGEGAT